MKMKQNKQFDALDAWLKQMEAASAIQSQSAGSFMTPTDSGMSSFESSLLAPENYLPLAAQLVAANPDQQNPKLISQALSVAPPVC